VLLQSQKWQLMIVMSNNTALCDHP